MSVCCCTGRKVEVKRAELAGVPYSACRRRGANSLVTYSVCPKSIEGEGPVFERKYLDAQSHENALPLADVARVFKDSYGRRPAKDELLRYIRAKAA